MGKKKKKKKRTHSAAKPAKSMETKPIAKAPAAKKQLSRTYFDNLIKKMGLDK